MRENYNQLLQDWSEQIYYCNTELIWLEREMSKVLVNLFYTNNFPKNIKIS